MNTLAWADEAAARGDHAGALAWLKTVEAIGDELPELYLSRRAKWRAVLGAATGPDEDSGDATGLAALP